jgi:hypothetical protein
VLVGKRVRNSERVDVEAGPTVSARQNAQYLKLSRDMRILETELRNIVLRLLYASTCTVYRYRELERLD